MPFSLLQAQPNNAENYVPIVMQLVFAIGMIVTILIGSSLLGPKRKGTAKLGNFESGIEVKGNARQPMAIKYFLVAILFVLFDVEVIFFYPYAVNFREFAKDPSMAWHTFGAIILFVALFLTGFIYIFKKGALKWEE